MGIATEGAEWQANLMHGQGKYTYASGDTYEGAYVNDKEHGTGFYRFADGSSYTGDWVAGRRHGRGIYVGTDGDIFQGDYREDVKSGFGAFLYPSGAKYEGQWAGDVMDGEGVYTFANSEQKIVRYNAGQCEERIDCTPTEAAALLARLREGRGPVDELDQQHAAQQKAKAAHKKGCCGCC